MMNHDIFISYSSKQKSIADGVCHYLEENGFKCWMAPRDISVGSEYGDLIEEAIKTCKIVVLVFSQSASISKWVKGEVNVAFAEDKPILPFRVDDTEIKGGFRVMLNQMHWIDAFPKYADRLPDLLNSVCGFLGRQPHKVSDDNERLEAERKAKDEAERERLEKESLERERRAEEARRKAEQERLERERAEAQRRDQQQGVTNPANPSANAESKPKKGLWIAVGAVAVVALVLILVLSKKDNDSKSYPFEASSPKVNEPDITISVNGVSFVMKPVEGGTFQMGSNDNEANEDEHPVHSVTVSSFYMGETEVTQALWQAVMGEGPKELNWSDKFGKGNLFPVYGVNLSEIIDDFLPKLNDLTGREFRLPTEAEWEFAARGGNNSNGYKYAGSNSINDVAWYVDNSAQMFHEVKSKKPNELGLYDMSGNVCEHCTDWYVPDYYSVSPSINPQGPSWGHYPVNRGGCVLHRKEFCRVSLRDNHDGRLIKLGFRLVLSK